MKHKSIFTVGIVTSIVFSALYIAGIIGIAYVAWHFISKWW